MLISINPRLTWECIKDHIKIFLSIWFNSIRFPDYPNELPYEYWKFDFCDSSVKRDARLHEMGKGDPGLPREGA